MEFAVSSEKVLRWNPKGRIEIKQNESGLPVIRPYRGDFTRQSGPFEVVLNKLPFLCEIIPTQPNIFKVLVGDARLNCCPVLYENERLGIYVCPDMRDGYGFCYRDIDSFVRVDRLSLRITPLRTIIEFNKEFIFLEFEKGEDWTPFQCIRTRKFVPRRRGIMLDVLFTRKKDTSSSVVGFHYLGEPEEETLIHYTPFTRGQFEGDTIHPSLGCIIHSFEGEEEETVEKEEVPQKKPVGTKIEPFEAAVQTFFPSGSQLVFRKRIDRKLLTVYKEG